jgi:hydroxyacylglutathione hydrolase/adenylyltransferase/sulfurtransferase
VPEAETATELAPERAAELTRDGARLIDVRGADEHEAGHIAGDELIPFDQLKARAGDLDPAAPVVLYCRSGDRSGAAVQALRASGYDAYSIEGGLVEWTEQGLPIEPEGGHVAQPHGLPPA